MKILWLCNLPLPNISISISNSASNRGGWLAGLSNDLRKCPEIDLSLCFPLPGLKEIIKGNLNNINYYGFPEKMEQPHKYDTGIERQLQKILNEVDPDIVHIFGTEFPHSLAMTKVYKNKNRMAINIQGLCSIISRHYTSGLPSKVISHFTLRDFLKQDNIEQQCKKFVRRGEYEAKAIKNVNHIIGRTTWDKACAYQINPYAKYHFCNETLRDEFYNQIWNINNCRRYSIFVSSGEYPVKGFHFMIEAMPEVIRRFPKAHLYAAGGDITKSETLKDKLRMSSYGMYIKQLINKYKLKDYITFTGNLDEMQMCGRYLKSNVFVMPSSIENSSNSLGEAKIMGVPCVAAYVGGAADRAEGGLDCYAYQHDAPYMLAHYICELFSNDELALEFSHNSRESALKIYDRQENMNSIINIYRGLLGG